VQTPFAMLSSRCELRCSKVVRSALKPWFTSSREACSTPRVRASSCRVCPAAPLYANARERAREYGERSRLLPGCAAPSLSSSWNPSWLIAAALGRAAGACGLLDANVGASYEGNAAVTHSGTAAFSLQTTARLCPMLGYRRITQV